MTDSGLAPGCHDLFPCRRQPTIDKLNDLWVQIAKSSGARARIHVQLRQPGVDREDGQRAEMAGPEIPEVEPIPLIIMTAIAGCGAMLRWRVLRVLMFCDAIFGVGRVFPPTGPLGIRLYLLVSGSGLARRDLGSANHQSRGALVQNRLPMLKDVSGKAKSDSSSSVQGLMSRSTVYISPHEIGTVSFAKKRA